MLLSFKQNKIKQKGLDSTEQLKHKQPCLKGLTEYKILGANNLNSTAASNCDLCKLYWGLGTFQSGFQSLALSQLECDRIYRRSVNGS